MTIYQTTTVVFFCLLNAVLQSATRGVEEKPQPDIRFASIQLRTSPGPDQIVSIGDVYPGEEVKIRVAIVNRAENDVTFQKVSVACKCLEGSMADKVIPGKGTGVADFRFFADKKPRSFSYSVSATMFFDGAAGVQSLRFVASYKNTASLPFSSLDINYSPNQKIDRTVPVFISKDVSLSDCKVKCNGEISFMNAKLEMSDGNAVIRLTSDGRNNEREEFNGKIELYLENELADECPVRILSRKSHRLSPSTLVFSNGDRDGFLEATAVFRVELEQSAPEPLVRSFIMKQADVNEKSFHCNVNRIGRGTYRIRASIAKQELRDGDAEWTLDFSTNHGSISGISKVLKSN